MDCNKRGFISQKQQNKTDILILFQDIHSQLGFRFYESRVILSVAENKRKHCDVWFIVHKGLNDLIGSFDKFTQKLVQALKHPPNYGQRSHKKEKTTAALR